MNTISQNELKESQYDVIVEMLANINLQTDLEMLAPRGRVMVCEIYE